MADKPPDPPGGYLPAIGHRYGHRGQTPGGSTGSKIPGLDSVFKPILRLLLRLRVRIKESGLFEAFTFGVHLPDLQTLTILEEEELLLPWKSSRQSSLLWDNLVQDMETGALNEGSTKPAQIVL